MREAGVPVELRIEGEPRPLATLTDWSAYRVVQEALTNVLKHAGEASVRVTISYGHDDLAIEIVDDGVGAPPGADSSGHGLVGHAGAGRRARRDPAVRRACATAAISSAPTCPWSPPRERDHPRPRRRRRRPDAHRAAHHLRDRTRHRRGGGGRRRQRGLPPRRRAGARRGADGRPPPPPRRHLGHAPDRGGRLDAPGPHPGRRADDVRRRDHRVPSARSRRRARSSSSGCPPRSWSSSVRSVATLPGGPGAVDHLRGPFRRRRVGPADARRADRPTDRTGAAGSRADGAGPVEP